MTQTFKPNINLVALDCDNDHILHRKGSDDYPEIRHTHVRADGVNQWEEIAIDAIPAKADPGYKQRVRELVAERYDYSRENGILREALAAMRHPSEQRDASAALAEFDAYNEFVEHCKVEALEQVTKISD